MDSLQLSNLLRIQEASQQGRLVFFVGAGVSNNSGVPTWSALINEMKHDCGAENETDDLKIAQLYKDARGEKEYMDKVKEVLLYNKVLPNKIHEKILELCPCHIITTNYDNLLEQEIESEYKQFAVVKEDKDIPSISYPNTLVKMHGDFDTSNIVLTESDYYNYNKNFPLIRSYVLSLFASKLVVFIGFSFADLNLKMILNEVYSVLQDSMQRVYLISDTCPSPTITTYYANKGINVVYLEKSDLQDVASEVEIPSELNNSKGIYLYKVLSCIPCVSKDDTSDLVSSLYAQLTAYKDEITVIGDGLSYLFPKENWSFFNLHSCGLQLSSAYFKALHQQLKTFAGRRKFILDHPEIEWKELRQFAYYNYLFEIDNIKIVDIDKQAKKNIAAGNFSATYYFYDFDFDNLSKRLLYLSSRDLSGDSKDLEYPFVLYKLGQYYDAYKEYRRILPLAWKRGKFILYFICLYNMWSLKNGVFFSLWEKDKDLAERIKAKLSNIQLEEVLSRLPISEGFRVTFQNLLSFRSLGQRTVEIEKKREELFKQRKSGERGGVSLNSNISSLLANFEREIQFCNYNYIVCDNNSFFKAICYNAVCGILNSYATPDNKVRGTDIGPSKIYKIFSFCLFAFVFCIKNKELQEIFRRYEIDSIELSDDGIEIINKYWNNLANAKDLQSIQISNFGEYIENLIYVTSKIETKGIVSNIVYDAVLKYWHIINSFRVDGSLLAGLIFRLNPDSDNMIKILNQLFNNMDYYDHFTDCYYLLAHYMSEKNLTYDIDMAILKKGNYAGEVCPLYKILVPTKQQTFSEYCQTNLQEAADYLEFIVDNELSITSLETFKGKVVNIKNNQQQYYRNNCYYWMSKMRHNEKYSETFPIIDEIASQQECLRFHLSPAGYEPKESVDIQWILRLDKDDFYKCSQIPAYKEKLKRYLIDERYMGVSQRNAIIEALVQ